MKWRTALETHLLTENSWLRHQLEVAQAKIERMELAIMPMTEAGRRYASKAEPVEPIFIPEGKDLPLVGGWRKTQEQNALDLKEAERDDALRQKANAQTAVRASTATDGTQAERSA
jgi:hypothetical protein